MLSPALPTGSSHFLSAELVVILWHFHFAIPTAFLLSTLCASVGPPGTPVQCVVGGASSSAATPVGHCEYSRVVTQWPGVGPPLSGI